MSFKYQLPTGKTVILTDDEFFDLDDDKLQQLIAEDRGIFLENPFEDLNLREFKKFDNNDEIIILDDLPNIEEIPIEVIKNIENEFNTEK